jgi:hypothetical protein
MEQGREHPTIIDLDDPTPRGMRFVMVACIVVLVALLVAPFLLDVHTSEEIERSPRDPVRNGQSQVCRPSVDVPDLLEPIAGFTMPSWMRLCDWFVEPVISPPGSP